MKSKALMAITRAESLISNWKWLPGSDIKLIISYLTNALDFVASYALDRSTIIERSYLLLSSVRLFHKRDVEEAFYDTYYYLRGLLRKDIKRVNPDKVKIIGRKQVIFADEAYFKFLVEEVKKVINEAFTD
jgi:hypothetical protein